MNELMNLLYSTGHGVCHQIPDRCLSHEALTMPLCARCTGIYLGAAFALAYVASTGRIRAGRFLPPKLLLLFIGLFSLMGVDVLTGSSLLNGLLQFREADSASRLSTGLLAGISLTILVLPAFNHLWRDDPDDSKSPLGGGKQTAILLLISLLVFILNIRPFSEILLLIFSNVSILSLIGVYMILNATILRTITVAFPPLDRYAPRPLLLTAGLLLGLLELGGMSALRYGLGI